MTKVGSAELLSALWPTLVLLGACLAAMAMAKRSAAATRFAMMAVSVLLLMRYYYWRASSTLPQCKCAMPARTTTTMLLGLAFAAASSAVMPQS